MPEIKFKQVNIKGKAHWYIFDIDGRIITHGKKVGSEFKTKEQLRTAFKQFGQDNKQDFFTLRTNAIQVGKHTFQFYNTIEKAKSRTIYKRTGWQFFVRVKFLKFISQAYSDKHTDKLNEHNIDIARKQALSYAMGQIDEMFYIEDDLIDSLEKSGRIQILRERIIYFDRI